MKIKELIKKNTWLNRIYINYKLRERKTSYGEENSDKVFYVIRRAPCSLGLFSYVSTVLGHIKYAVDRGYIPVVDMQNYANTYLADASVGKVNAWELYFKQPMGYTLEDIKNSKHIILSWAEGTKEYPYYRMVVDPKDYHMWYQYAQKYLCTSDEITRTLFEEQKRLFGDKRIIGVLCRGTDYINNRPPNHPIQPSVAAVIDKTTTAMQEHNYEYVFLATEDEDIYRQFKKQFKDKLLISKARLYKNTGHKNINDVVFDRKNDPYLRGREYLVTIMLLSRCNYMVAGCVGGTYGAMLLTKGFEGMYVFFEGCYPNLK